MEYKCSSEEHKNLEAISYCHKCDIYLCNKCENIHCKLCPKHQAYKLNHNLDEIFTGYCMEKDHNEKLEFFCKIIINYVVHLVYVKKKIKEKVNTINVMYALLSLLKKTKKIN